DQLFLLLSRLIQRACRNAEPVLHHLDLHIAICISDHIDQFIFIELAAVITGSNKFPCCVCLCRNCVCLSRNCVRLYRVCFLLHRWNICHHIFICSCGHCARAGNNCQS